MKTKDYEDDGHTIADMSEIEGSKGIDFFRAKEVDNDEHYTLKELIPFIQGTMLSTLLIASCYIVGLGLVCLIFYLAFLK